MATIKYSDLITDVIPTLAADPSDPVTEHAIKRAVIEFIGKSWIWQHFPDPIDVVAGEPVYDLEPPQSADIAVVVSVMLDGNTLTPKQPLWLDENVRYWRTERNTPRYFTQLDNEQVILAPVPAANQAGGLVMTLAVQPAMNSTSFPRWIASKYLDDIVSGALARLMMMPGQGWTDLPLGKDHEARFKAAIANARADVVTDMNRSATRTESQY